MKEGQNDIYYITGGNVALVKEQATFEAAEQDLVETVGILELLQQTSNVQNFQTLKQSVADEAKFPNNGVFIIDLEKEMNGGRLQEDIAHTLEIKDSKASDLAQAQALEASPENNCALVESHFDARREKRNAEIDGLVEAKNCLAGAAMTVMISCGTS